MTDSLFAEAYQHHQARRLIDAERIYWHILNICPQHADSLHLLGLICYTTGRQDQGLEMIQKAVAINPDEVLFLSNLGIIYQDQGRMIEAILTFRQIISIKPDDSEMLSILGNALKGQGLLEDAVEAYRKGLSLDPNNVGLLNSIGNVLREQGLLDEAVEAYRKASFLNPDEPHRHYNLAEALLAKGDFTEGWAEHEWRLKMPYFAKIRANLDSPQWVGDPAEGQTLLVHCEGGFGDTLQFCRYVPLAAARGLRVILIVQKPLVRLLAELKGVDHVIEVGAKFPPFDLSCWMFSLPFAFKTTLPTIPSHVPYLRPAMSEVIIWRTKLNSIDDTRPRVGVVWAGNPYKGLGEFEKLDRRRSLPLSMLASLFTVEGLHFVSLQKDTGVGHLGFPLTDMMDQIFDFADTAALIANLDLVISVDTAVAHLAAALGKPVWLLDRSDHSWRWLSGQRKSPWYPTLRIYRQPRQGDWDAVLVKVVYDLKEFSQKAQKKVRSST